MNEAEEAINWLEFARLPINFEFLDVGVWYAFYNEKVASVQINADNNLLDVSGDCERESETWR